MKTVFERWRIEGGVLPPPQYSQRSDTTVYISGPITHRYGQLRGAVGVMESNQARIVQRAVLRLPLICTLRNVR